MTKSSVTWDYDTDSMTKMVVAELKSALDALVTASTNDESTIAKTATVTVTFDAQKKTARRRRDIGVETLEDEMENGSVGVRRRRAITDSKLKTIVLLQGS